MGDIENTHTNELQYDRMPCGSERKRIARWGIPLEE